VLFRDEPWVPENERVSVSAIAPGFWRVQVTYGFKDKPDIPRALLLCASQDLHIDLFETSYFLSRETVIPTKRPGMALWRERLFAFMTRNAANIADFLRLPSNCVIELGTRVRI
jgi:KUP system potassium uptake protein